MSFGYRGNGGVVGFKNSWTATQGGVWGVRENYFNRNWSDNNQKARLDQGQLDFLAGIT